MVEQHKRMSKSVNLVHAQTDVPCNVCEDEAPGQYYCIECKQALCPQCEKYHRRSALSKDHNVVLRTQIGDINTTTLSCTDHGDQASFHCEKCDIAICTKCITEKHKGHPLSELVTIFDKEKKLLLNDISRMQTKKLPKLKKRGEDMIIAKKKNEKTIEQIIKDMEAENQAFHRELDKRHEERIKNLVSIRDSQLAKFNAYSKEIKTQIDLYEERISEYQDAIGKNNLTTLIKVTRGKQSLPEIGSESVLQEPPTFVPGNIHTILENLGKLNVASPSSVVKPLKLRRHTVVSEFQCPLQGFPSICITKEGDVWLGGYESRVIVLVDIKGQVLRRKPVQNRVAALAVMDCGDLIICPRADDSSSVSRLLNNDTEIRVFDATPFGSNGVSVSADQKIQICTWDGKLVKTNGDGTNVKQIYKSSGVDSIIHAVENADGNIYISDHSNCAVVMVSKDGKVLSTITHTTGQQTLKSPWGLVVDKMGNILCSDYKNHCVYIIDQNQQIRELLGRSHDIQNPRWLAVDGDNNLWIMHSHGKVQVVNYLSP